MESRTYFRLEEFTGYKWELLRDYYDEEVAKKELKKSAGYLIRRRLRRIEEKTEEITVQSLLSHKECLLYHLPTCHSGKDGDCDHPQCIQNRDGEPAKTGRHCPFDWDREQDYH
jgi:hypothetical protein